SVDISFRIILRRVRYFRSYHTARSVGYSETLGESTSSKPFLRPLNDLKIIPILFFLLIGGGHGNADLAPTSAGSYLGQIPLPALSERRNPKKLFVRSGRSLDLITSRARRTDCSEQSLRHRSCRMTNHCCYRKRRRNCPRSSKPMTAVS